MNPNWIRVYLSAGGWLMPMHAAALLLGLVGMALCAWAGAALYTVLCGVTVLVNVAAVAVGHCLGWSDVVRLAEEFQARDALARELEIMRRPLEFFNGDGSPIRARQ